MAVEETHEPNESRSALVAEIPVHPIRLPLTEITFAEEWSYAVQSDISEEGEHL